MRAGPLVDVDRNRVVPEEYFPDDTNEGKVIQITVYVKRTEHAFAD